MARKSQSCYRQEISWTWQNLFNKKGEHIKTIWHVGPNQTVQHESLPITWGLNAAALQVGSLSSEGCQGTPSLQTLLKRRQKRILRSNCGGADKRFSYTQNTWNHLRDICYHLGSGDESAGPLAQVNSEQHFHFSAATVQRSTAGSGTLGFSF